MSRSENFAVKYARIIVILTGSILALALLFFALFVHFDGKTNLSKREIEENLDTITDTGYSYACSYVADLGIKNFNQAKFRRLEAYYNAYYIYEMKSPLVMAKETVSRFLDRHYDTVNLSDTSAVTDKLLECYVLSTGDRFGVYRNKAQSKTHNEDLSGEFYGIGVTIRSSVKESITTVTIVEVTKDGPADKAGIKAGDLLIKIDGKDVSTLTSNGIAEAVRGKDGTTVRITVLRNGAEIECVATRGYVESRPVDYRILNDGKIGYIIIREFNEKTATKFSEALTAVKTAGVEGIVFDLRNNPGGLVSSAVDVISHFVPAGTDIISFHMKGYEKTTYTSKGYGSVDVPIVVVCNKDSASAAELFTAAMRDYNDMGLLDAIIVGEVTRKKGVMQNEYGLGDGSTITLTVSLYNPPSDVNYDGIGVRPDYEEEDSEALIDVAIEYLYSVYYTQGNAA